MYLRLDIVEVLKIVAISCRLPFERALDLVVCNVGELGWQFAWYLAYKINVRKGGELT